MFVQQAISFLSAEYHVSTILVFLLVLGLSLYLFRRPKNIPPGPWRLPLVGCVSYMLEKHLGRAARTLAKEYDSDVITVYVGPQPLVFLNSYSAAREAFYTDILMERPDSIFYKSLFTKGKGLLSSEGDLWKEQRRFTLTVMRDFGMGKMHGEEHVRDEIQLLVNEFEKRCDESFEVGPLFNMSASNIICFTTFGRRFDYDDEEFLYYCTRIQVLLKQFNIISPIILIPSLRHIPGDPAGFRQIDFNYHEVQKFITKQIKEHKASFDPDNIKDLTDTYLAKQAEENGKTSTFTDEQLRHVLFELFFAGTDTTSTTLQFTILYMIKYPDVQRKVQAEIDEVLGREKAPSIVDRRHLQYTDATILEVMRLCPVAPLGIPHCNNKSDVTLQGYTIPKGSFVLANIWSIQRDPTIWKSPEEFNPNNFLDEEGNVKHFPEMVPFGTGRRQCLGETLAKMEVFLVFVSLLQKFHFTVPEGAPTPDVEPEFGLALVPQPFKVCVSKRT